MAGYIIRPLLGRSNSPVERTNVPTYPPPSPSPLSSGQTKSPPGKMPRPAVAVVAASALLCVCLYLHRPTTPPARAGRPHRRSGRHLATPAQRRQAAAAFDPLAGDPEHGVVDLKTFQDTLDRLWAPRDWSKVEAELGPLDRYFGAEGRLDVRERLMYLFPMVDRSPADGGVSFEELEAWLHRQAMDRLMQATHREMANHDDDGDGAVTLREYLPFAPDQDIDWNKTERGEPGWWREKFAAVDRDGNGSLDAVEFNDFLHPEDSSQERVQHWLQKEKLSEMDHDGDRRLSLEEFVDQSHMIDRITVSDNYDGPELHLTEAEKKFRELDSNMDGYLTAAEVQTAIQSLLTGELSYATSYAKYLMKEADDDRDGKLSLKEMLDHNVAFYNIVYMDDQNSYDDVDDEYHHEELR